MARLNRLLSPLFWLVLTLTATLTVMGNSRTLFRLAHLPETAGRLLPLLLFVLALSTLVLYLWKTVAHAPGAPTPAPTPTPAPGKRAVWWITLPFTLCLATQTLSQLTVPLDWDEHEHATLLASPDYARALNPFLGSENHALASAAAGLSMKILGVGKTAARIPALLFALFFLIALNLFSFRFLNRWEAFALWALLAANQMVVYTLHQMRGYTPLFLFSFLCLWLVLEVLYHNRPTGRGFGFLYFSCAALALLSHTFGGLFLGILFLTTLINLYVRRDSLSAATLRRGNSLAWLTAGLLVAYGVLSVFILAHLQETGFALNGNGERPVWLQQLMLFRPFTLFGLVRLWEIKLFALLTALTLAVSLRMRATQPVWFAATFLAVLLALLLALFRLIGFTVLEGRMLQPFLIVFLWVVVAAVAQVQGKWLRPLVVTTLILFLGAPWFCHRDQSDGVPEFFAGIESFAREVRIRTADRADRCYSFSGDASTVGYLKHFYLAGEKTGTDCAQPFHLFIEKGIFQRPGRIDPALYARGEVVYHDGRGRFLFHLRPALSPSRLSWEVPR